MTKLQRLVLDTNVLVSAAFRNGSLPHRTLLKARMEARLLASDETLAEFREVLLREKFDRYLNRDLRVRLLEEYARLCTLVPIPSPIRACRDFRDDKFLEVAVHGRADAIVTGDADLLDLNPFLGIMILSPREYVERE
jgi:putative PIN family toxin of toxin-antitoxin system